MKTRKIKVLQKLRKEHKRLGSLIFSLKANRASKADETKIAQAQKEYRSNELVLGLR